MKSLLQSTFASYHLLETASLAALFLSLVTIALWFLFPDFSLRLTQDFWIGMSPQMGCCFMLMSVALLFHNQNPFSAVDKVLMVSTGMFISAVMILVVCQPFNVALFENFQEWLRDTSLSPFTTIGVLVLSCSLTLCPLAMRRHRKLGDILGGLVLFVITSFIYFLIAHFYGVHFLDGKFPLPPLMGVMGVTFVGCAILGCLGPGYFPMRPFVGPSVRAVLLRKLVPVTMGGVFIFALVKKSIPVFLSAPIAFFITLMTSSLIVIYLAMRASDVVGQQLEAALKDSEQRYTHLVGSLKDYAVLLLDPRGAILVWNPGAERMTGFRAKDVLGEHASRIFLSKTGEMNLANALDRTNADGAYYMEGWVGRQDSETFWAETTFNRLNDEKGKSIGISITMRDATERKRAEVAVKEKAALIQLMSATASASNVAERLDDVLPLVIREVCSYTEWPIGTAWTPISKTNSLAPLAWFSTNPIRYAPFLNEVTSLPTRVGDGFVGRAFQSGKIEWLTNIADHNSKSTLTTAAAANIKGAYAVPVKNGVDVVAVLEFFSDEIGEPKQSWQQALSAMAAQLSRVSERERSASALKESEQRFRLVTESARDAIVSFDKKGTILGWNKGANLLFGYKDTEILGQSITQILGTSFDAAVLTDIENALRLDSESPRGKAVEATGHRKNGDNVPIEFSLSGWKSGDTFFFAAIVRDITRRKMTEDTMKASLLEKEIMLKEIHHRVKNNLQVISSLLRLQSDKARDKETVDLFLDSQERVRAMAMVHEFLYQSQDLARINFPAYVASLVRNLYRTYGLTMSEQDVKISVDDVLLSLDVAVPCGLILTELVSNAMKYAYPEKKEGGRIHVGFRSLPNQAFELTVADEGVGFAKNFDWTTSNSLGLRLVHILTEQLQGKINFSSDKGTKFTVTFTDHASRIKTGEKK